MREPTLPEVLAIAGIPFTGPETELGACPVCLATLRVLDDPVVLVQHGAVIAVCASHLDPDSEGYSDALKKVARAVHGSITRKN